MMETQPLTSAFMEGSFTLSGQFTHGSNYTFLGDVAFSGESIPVVYKPTRGEQPLWDFPPNTLAKRETAAYLFSRWLGWDLVPLTVYRRRGLPFGPGSLQKYIPHDAGYHYFNFSGEDRARLVNVALFDLLMNNADRKGSHVLVDEAGRLWCIDHGLCFHSEDKLRTVIWTFAGQEVPQNLLADLARLRSEKDGLHALLKPYLRVGEVNAILHRAEKIWNEPVFPQPGTDRRMFPFPPM